MANFSNIFRAMIEAAQSQKEVTANDAIEALSKHAGKISKSIAAGGTINLTDDESRSGCILLTGSPGSTTTVVQSANVTSFTVFRNDTTGGQTIQVKLGAGGTLFTVPVAGLVVLLSTTEALLLQSNTVPLSLGTTGSAGTAEGVSRVDHKHPRDVECITFNVGSVTWTDQPAALTELFGLNDRRCKYDLTQFTEARLIANVETIGGGTASLRAEFSTTDGGTYAALDNTTGPNVSILTAGTIVSSYVSLTASAKADVFLRIIGIDGDAAADPVIGNVYLQVR